MKKNHLARVAVILAGALSLASCDLGAFFHILGSLTPTTGNMDDPREHLSINLDYHDGENYAVTETRYKYEDIHDSTRNYPCPSYGNVKLLVIPVKIQGFESVATTDNLSRIQNAFFGESEKTGWESVSTFYKKSSYGALNITGVVPDQWYDSGLTTTQIEHLEAKPGAANASSFDRTWNILEDAVSWYKETYHDDCDDFDIDKDGYIDGVWLVYGAPDHKNRSGLDEKLWWAYNFKDYSATTPVPGNPVAYSYCWASYDFMDAGGYEPVGGLNSVDAHTYIHETGHLMGLEDYYVASCKAGELNYGPMGGLDMMDYNIIDHNAWSKYAYGWIKPYVVSGSCEITLKKSCTAGEAIILPTSKSFNDSAFDEFIMMEYYTPDLLNYQDSFVGYGDYPHGFTENGVRIYHVDARLATMLKNTVDGDYDEDFDAQNEVAIVAHSNSSGYNQKNADKYLEHASLSSNFVRYRLIQEMDCTHKRNFDTSKQTVGGRELGVFADNTTLFQDGDTFSYELYKESFPNYVNGGSKTMNDGGTLPWTVSFSESNGDSIKVTITHID